MHIWVELRDFEWWSPAADLVGCDLYVEVSTPELVSKSRVHLAKVRAVTGL